MTVLPTRPPQRRVVTASASKIASGKDSQYARRVQQPWQDWALWAYSNCGEVHFSSDFYARLLSRLRIFPATLSDDGTKTEITSGAPVEVLARIQDPGGGRSRLQFDYGRLMFITGEGYLFVSERNGQERWKFLWRQELFLRDDGVAVKKDGNGQLTNETGVAYRMWTPHPANSDLADAPMLAVRTIVEELIALTDSVLGLTKTRLTNGILAIASEFTPDPVEPGTDEDPRANIWIADWINHLQAQIDNPASASSKIPFVVEGAFEYIQEGIKWIKTYDMETYGEERQLRQEAIHRLALSMDFPPEVLEGLTGANHWSGAIVQQEVWRSHGVIQAEQFCDDICEAYLRPALEAEGYGDIDHIVVDFDDSEVVVSPDRGVDADNAADRGMISDDGYRFLKGIPKDMAPSDDEKQLWAAVKTRDLPSIDDAFGVVNMAGPTAETPSGNGNQPGVPAAPTQGRSGTRQEARIAAALLGAARMAIRQCRAKAGARLRSYQGCEECVRKIDGLPNSLVAAALGQEQLDALGVPDAATLVKGGADEFRGYLVDVGLSEADADNLAGRIEMYAAKSLMDEQCPEFPPGFVAQVESIVEVIQNGVPAEAAA